MSLATAKGSFAANTTTGNQSVSGLSFQPSAVILWVTQQTATGYAANYYHSYGWGTSSTQRVCVSAGSNDASAAAATAHSLLTNAIINIYSSATTPTVDAVADLVSLDATGFTINWSDAPAAAVIVHYFCIGGADITNAKAGTFTLATTGASQAVTDPGFQPDLLLIMDTSLTSTGNTSGTAQFCFAAASGTANSAFAAFSDHNGGGTTQTGTYQRSDSLWAIISAAATPAESWRTTLSSFDATGFTFAWASANPGAAVIIPYLAIKGGQYKVGVETQATSVTTKATTGIGFQPTGLLLFGRNFASSTAVGNSDAKFSLGATDGTNQGCTWLSATDALTSNTDDNSRTVTADVLTHSTNSSTTNAEAAISSLDSDGFTLNWTTADATAREFVYVAMGNAAAGATTTITAAGGIARPTILVPIAK